MPTSFTLKKKKDLFSFYWMDREIILVKKLVDRHNLMARMEGTQQSFRTHGRSQSHQMWDAEPGSCRCHGPCPCPGQVGAAEQCWVHREPAAKTGTTPLGTATTRGWEGTCFLRYSAASPSLGDFFSISPSLKNETYTPCFLSESGENAGKLRTRLPRWRWWGCRMCGFHSNWELARIVNPRHFAPTMIPLWNGRSFWWIIFQTLKTQFFVNEYSTPLNACREQRPQNQQTTANNSKVWLICIVGTAWGAIC